MLQTLPFAAGGRQINAKASFFRYESGDAGGLDTSVRVRADGNDLGLFLPGDNIELPVSASRWELVPVSGSCTGTVRLGMGKVSGSRLVGTVNVIDAAAAKTRTGNQFIGLVAVGAAVGFVSMVGVWANGKTVAVKSFKISSASAGNVAIGFATNRGTGLGVANALASKLAGSPGSTHGGCYGTISTSVPTAGESPGWSAFGTMNINSNTPTELVTHEPIVLTANMCLAVIGQSTNRDLFIQLNTEEVV